MSGLLCSHCLLAGKRIPSKLNHIGDDRYASHAKAVLDGNSLCEDHLKEAVKEKRKARP